LGIGEAGMSSAASSMDGYPVRERWEILETRGDNALRKIPLVSDTVMLTVRLTAPARSRHKGTNRFHPVLIDAQFLGLEVMALRQ